MTVDRDRFADLVRPHWPEMSALADRLGPDDDGDDVLQEALAAAWRRRDQLDGTSEPAHEWLLVIVADQARRGHRRRPSLALIDPDPDADDPADPDGPERLDFDEALELATDDDEHDRTKRSALRWAGAAAAIVLIAGIAAALAWKSPSRDAVGSGAARTLRVNGHTYVQRTVPADAAARDAAHPASIDVFVFAAAANSDVRCTRLRPSAQVVDQTASTVTIRASVFRVATTGTYYCGYAGTSSDYTKLTVRLTRPLEGRALVNETDGSPIAIVEPTDPPRPSHLPAGYAAAGGQRVDPAHGTLVALRRYTRGDNELRVDARPTVDAPAHRGAPDGIATVDRFRAEVRHDPGSRCIVWVPRPGITRSVCSTGPTLLSRDELLAVARSLP